VSELRLRDKDFSTLTRRVDVLVGVHQGRAAEVARLEAETARLKAESDVLTYTGAALRQLLQTVSAEAITAVEQLETYGLQVIFDDQSLVFKIETSQKRGVQWMEPKLLQGEVEAPILDAFGGGPATVVAFLLRVLVLKRLGLAPVLLLDEPFSMVSAEYVASVGKLLRELCEMTGMVMIMVTHQPAFMEHAHKAYEAQETGNGTVFRGVGG
jgi:ABC-type dipeptide/oligopeptide/nickel transport system ATPase subunit